MSSLATSFDVTFRKTQAGRAEVAQRKRGLSSRQRMALILIDGRKRLAELAMAVSPEELAGIGSHLMGLGLIEAVEVSKPAEAAAPALVAAPVPSESSLSQIKEIMTRSAETYLGLMAADVVRRVQKAGDEAELMRAVGHWHMAMRESKYGKDVAGALLEQVKASVRSPAEV